MKIDVQKLKHKNDKLVAIILNNYLREYEDVKQVFYVYDSIVINELYPTKVMGGLKKNTTVYVARSHAKTQAKNLLKLAK